MAEEEYLYQRLSYEVIGAAIEVHKTLGPGLPENVYQKAFERELTLRMIPFESEREIIVEYKGTSIAKFYLDLVVADKIVVELKALEKLAPVHESQLLTYLAASKLRLGLLFNFGEDTVRTKRLVR